MGIDSSTTPYILLGLIPLTFLEIAGYGCFKEVLPDTVAGKLGAVALTQISLIAATGAYFGLFHREATLNYFHELAQRWKPKADKTIKFTDN
jgi:hypothetical protein